MCPVNSALYFIGKQMKNAVKRRKIDCVWHFTRLSNLDSILKHGLISRKDLENSGIKSDFNDDYRFDCEENAICCSLGHPNYKMFYSLRQNNPDIEWVVLALIPDVLWEKDCAFCVSNAASNEVTCIPITLRKGLDAFNKLFEEIDGKPTRAELEISDRSPTNPQAEILIFDRIEPKHIIGVITQYKATETDLKTKYENSAFDILYHNALFSPRKDYIHW